jgi:hypothetical protein
MLSPSKILGCDPIQAASSKKTGSSRLKIRASLKRQLASALSQESSTAKAC